MYQDMQTEHEMRQHLHMLSKTLHVLSKGSWKKGQQKLVKEKQVREGTEVVTWLVKKIMSHLKKPMLFFEFWVSLNLN